VVAAEEGAPVTHTANEQAPIHQTALGLRWSLRGPLAVVLRWVLYLIVLAVFLVPLWSIAATALSRDVVRPDQLALIPRHPTLQPLRQAWKLGVARGLLNSLIVVAVGLTLQIAVSALAAYALARKRFRGATLVMVGILATMMMPEEVIAIPLYLVLRDLKLPWAPHGLLNTYSGLILPLVGWALPIFILTQFMKEIPIELEDSARIDGAGDLRIFTRVILPLCRPALGATAIFGFLMIWDQYLLPLLVASNAKKTTLTVTVTNLNSSQDLPVSVRMAAALVLLVPSVLVYLGLQRFFRHGLLTGSVKG
jgi:multiple sugar transport system permease protein